ncbi:MAG TPA: hypothetical protein VG326_06795 [Tepidisphaeraceae bacterium]|jgi:hypothetical protein|nr:hypothetical protein [Tepidisphaeraceae bacterium]
MSYVSDVVIKYTPRQTSLPDEFRSATDDGGLAASFHVTVLISRNMYQVLLKVRAVQAANARSQNFCIKNEQTRRELILKPGPRIIAKCNNSYVIFDESSRAPTVTK